MIKVYTDIEQSQKLAEILPLESADMYLDSTDDGRSYLPKFGKSIAIERNLFSYRNGLVVPCWSLAALFDTLPKTIGSYSKMMGYFDDAYHCDYLDEDGESLGNGTTADTLIDAVYEMVLIQNKKTKQL